jgi:hypothetical protein
MKDFRTDVYFLDLAIGRIAIPLSEIGENWG